MKPTTNLKPRGPAKSRKRHGRTAGWALAFLGACGLPLTAAAAQRGFLDREDAFAGAKLSHELRAARSAQGSSQMVKVIIQYKRPVMNNMAAPGELEMRAQGARTHARLGAIRAVVMTVPAWMIPQIAKNPNVAYITPDRSVQMTGNDEDEGSAVARDVAATQFNVDGTGIGVAVIDSGVADHADLHDASGASRVVYSESFVAGDATTSDKYGHGTHVAGIIGGNGASSQPGSGYARPLTGMAAGVRIINLRVLDENGAGNDSQTIAAIQRAIALKNTYNIRVMNISLGRKVYESYSLDPLCQAVEAAWKAGIVVVVAAGNSGRDNSLGTHGYSMIGAPGNDPYVLTVGATRTRGTASRADDVKASYSSKGPSLIDHIVKPDLVAPGNRIASLRAPGSTLDTTHAEFEEGSVNGGTPQYYRLSGTSMATPVVAGAAALMLQQDPSLTPDKVKARLMKTAWKGFGLYSSSIDNYGAVYSDQYDVFSYGAGYLDVQAALSNTEVAQGLALSPTAVYNALNGSVYLANTTIPAFQAASTAWQSGSSE